MLNAKNNKKQPGERPAPVVYCGPTLPGIARQYTVYKDGIPPQLAANPFLHRLVLPLAKMPEARRQLREKSGVYYSLFAAAAKEL